MTKKDIIKIADVLNTLPACTFFNETLFSQTSKVRDAFADMLAKDNPNFYRAKFMAYTEKRFK